ELLRPVDALGGVPLPHFPLLVQTEQGGAAVLVLPAERGRELLCHVPRAVRGRHRIAVGSRHQAPPHARAIALMRRVNTLARKLVSSKTAAATRTRGGQTVARILEGALELLNRPDGAAVTTNHIAAHLRMSPGNLYYHFRNREEIVRAIFPRLVAEALAATAPPAGSQLTAHEFGERHLQGVGTLWRYRFLFRDLNQLIA